MNTPSEVEIAWFAGLVDGEGCIHITRRRATRTKSPCYILYFTVAMTHLPAIEKIKSIWGVGSIRSRPNKKSPSLTTHQFSFSLQ